MSTIKIGPLENISKDFVPKHLQYSEKDPYYFRNLQTDRTKFRALSTKDIEILVKNNNSAENWDKVLVSTYFDPSLVKNCDFWGMVRIGNLTRSYLEYHKLRLPVGLNNCTITSCDIGDNVVMRNVQYLSHYVIGRESILFNIDEMITVDNAKFGNGIVKDGEEEKVRIWLEIGNENGGRKVLPFVGMLTADAYIWSKFRDDQKLMEIFKKMTDNLGDTRRGYYGLVGEHSVIKDCRIINSVNIGPNCYIKGANKLKNLTIQSSEQEPTQIGEGCELVNGIIGYGNNIFYGVKAVRFLTDRNVQLKYGARLLNSCLGANSNISCCEVLNNLIYPFHEQHHNNSFLIASTVMGQSNIAAGATIGSNHNSRAADGEIIAKRGFWPGLVTNFKHNSFFASFCLLAKGSYPAELNISLPFSLVSMGDDQSTIRIFPAYWFKHNLYALERNAWKFKMRDKRLIKDQNIETDYLAPDTVEEMFEGIKILHKGIQDALGKEISLREISENKILDHQIQVQLDGLMNKGKAIVLKPIQAIQLYQMMIFHYGARELVSVLNEASGADKLEKLKSEFKNPEHQWHNVGGQLMTEGELFRLMDEIKGGKLDSWHQLHKRYHQLWLKYPLKKRNHGLFSLFKIESLTIKDLIPSTIKGLLLKEKAIAKTLLGLTFESREKDYSNEFRKLAYRNKEEMEAVLGKISENSFLNEYKESIEIFIENINRLIEEI